MKFRLILMVCVCLWAVSASGQIDPNSNGIGIYADLDGMTNEVELEVGDPIEVYLLLTRPTGDLGLSGWECSLIVPENVTVWGWYVPVPGAVSISDPPAFMSGYPAPLPYQAANLLMKFIIVPLDSQPAQFFIAEYPYSTPVDAPRYVNWNGGSSDDMTLIDMVPYPGGETMASFTINPEALPVISATWGVMKSLYR